MDYSKKSVIEGGLTRALNRGATVRQPVIGHPAQKALLKRVFDPLNCAWMLLACVEVAGFAYLFFAISNAAHASMG